MTGLYVRSALTFSFFYSTPYFLLKGILLSYSEFITVSRLYGGDPCSALRFPEASLIMQPHNSLHLPSASRRDYQTPRIATVREKTCGFFLRRKRTLRYSRRRRPWRTHASLLTQQKRGERGDGAGDKPPGVFLIICEDQQCSRMHEGRDSTGRSTGREGLIGSDASITHGGRSRGSLDTRKVAGNLAEAAKQFRLRYESIPCSHVSHSLRAGSLVINKQNAAGVGITLLFFRALSNHPFL